MKNHRFRAIFAQSIAVAIKNFLLLDLGIVAAFPVILIPALTGLSSDLNPNETLRITAVEASWLGSIGSILTILGSLSSGIITEPMGRKWAMILVNIPHLLGWLLLYFSTSLTEIFIGKSLLGLGVGLMEAPIITYVGEICEASVRDVMLSTSGISGSLGVFVVFFAGKWFDWRTVALICSSIPVAGLILLLFVPETPIWLLSRHRDAEASKSLQWLRGWVPESAIEKELSDLKEYREYANSCADCQAQKIKCNHPLPSLMDKFKGIFQASYAKPMLIMAFATFFTYFTAIYHYIPYLAQILNTYETPMSPSNSMFLVGVTGFIATITYSAIAKFMSKRSVYMICIAGTAISNLWLGIHGLYYLPANSKSFEHANEVYVGENASYIPLVMLIILRVFSTALCIIPIMYASELFPMKSRCIAAGIAQAISYVMGFIATKTFYDLESWLDMSMSFCIYGVIGVFGLYVAYKTFPVTEGRTLEEIEKHFSDRNNKLTDWKIQAKTSDP